MRSITTDPLAIIPQPLRTVLTVLVALATASLIHLPWWICWMLLELVWGLSFRAKPPSAAKLAIWREVRLVKRGTR